MTAIDLSRVELEGAFCGTQGFWEQSRGPRRAALAIYLEAGSEGKQPWLRDSGEFSYQDDHLHATRHRKVSVAPVYTTRIALLDPASEFSLQNKGVQPH